MIFFRFLLLFFAMLSVGCTTDITDESNIVVNGCTTTLTLSTPSTRISLGEKEGENYPVYWSEGDKIVVNGTLSEEAVIEGSDATSATFTFDEKLSYPYSVTYPYTSTTTAEAPKVVVPTVQQYREGTFAEESVPMCGYAAKSGDKVQLNHLVGLLKFSVSSSIEGAILDRVVITATNGSKLSGEFEVNCSAATMVAQEGATNTITYTLPENFALSTEDNSVLFISVPAGDLGTCTIDFIESSGEKMACQWSSNNVKAGVVKEFKDIIYKRGVTGSLTPMEIEEDDLFIYHTTVVGTVKDTSGNPIEGVAVSNGFEVVATDANGDYTLNATKDCRYIYISTPAEYEIETNELGQPCFYKPYPNASNRYDFTLTPLAGGKEEKFALFTFADPQVWENSNLNRLLNEAIPEIYSHCNELKAQGIPCYGITLGDIISNSASTDTGQYRDDLRDAFSLSKVGMAVFQVMGNHDNTYFNSAKPIFADEANSSFELTAQREHEEVFGPVNYSFDRGDVHIIGMRNIVYQHNNTPSSYAGGFLPSQYEWLKQDLALVPKDKMVVLCVHIPMYNSKNHYIQEVLSLLDEYKEAHILSGHAHRQQLYEHTERSDSSHKVFEHNTGAVCGAWWASNIAGDGTPNGYNVFIGEGDTFSDWYFMGYNKGINSRSHQMRLYRGNATTGGEISGSNSHNIKGYYAFSFGEDCLLANVYNADSKWKIEVYEDGEYSGDMTKVSGSAPSFSTLVGDGSLENPFRMGDGVVAAVDLYVTGLHLGLLGRWSASSKAPSGGGYHSCWHLYQYTLKNRDADIKVVAIDRFGNRYTESVITEGTDYSLVLKP